MLLNMNFLSLWSWDVRMDTKVYLTELTGIFRISLFYPLLDLRTFNFLIYNFCILIKKKLWLFFHHFLLSNKLHLCISNWVDEMMYLMCFNYCLNRVKFGSRWYRGNISGRIKSCNHATGISSLYRNFSVSNPFYM